MGITEQDLNRGREARHDLANTAELLALAPDFAQSVRFAQAAYLAANEALSAAVTQAVAEGLETEDAREAVRAMGVEVLDLYRFLRGRLRYVAFTAPLGETIPATELRRRRVIYDQLLPVDTTSFGRQGAERQLATLSQLREQLPKAGLPGVEGAPFWATLHDVHGRMEVAVATWIRERGEDRASSRALMAARSRFDKAQALYIGLAEVILRWLGRSTELGHFAYRRDPAYRAERKRGAGAEEPKAPAPPAPSEPEAPEPSEPV